MAGLNKMSESIKSKLNDQIDYTKEISLLGGLNSLLFMQSRTQIDDKLVCKLGNILNNNLRKKLNLNLCSCLYRVLVK